jgi:mRNA interferase RelE/StbE
MAEIDVSERAADWLRDAEPDVRDRIVKKFRSIEDFPDHYLKSLSGSPYHRLRIGGYRAIIDWRRDENPEVLFVREIGPRRNIYD